MPAKDVTCTANATANTYKLTLKNEDNSTYKEVWYKYESGKFYREQDCQNDITSEIQKMEKVGHTFKGYFDGNTGVTFDKLTNFVDGKELTVKWTVNTYKLTYNWNLGKDGVDFARGEYIDTGFTPNWDQDFTITTTGRIDSFSGGTLLFGNNVDGIPANRIGIDVGTDGDVVVYQAETISSGKKMKTGEYTLVFEWKGSDHSYTLTITQKDEKTVEYTAKNLTGDISDTTWRFGGTDGRVDKNKYQGTHIDSFKITTEYKYDTDIYNPSNPSGNATGYKSGTWKNLVTKMPAADTTITAQWSK